MTQLLLLFALGILYDVTVVLYTNSIVERRPILSAFTSMWLGWASITGYGEALKDIHQLGALVCGYGVGTFMTTLFLRWKEKRHAS